MTEYRITCGKRNEPAYRAYFYVMAETFTEARSQASFYLKRGQIILEVK